MPFDPQLLSALSGLHFKARYIMEGFLTGYHDSPFHGFSVEFSEYRAYQPGDELKHVDWRLFARTDRLCIKRFEQETNARFYIVVDSSGSMAYRGDRAWASKLECAQTVATALTGLMLKQNDAVGLLALEHGRDALLKPAYIAPSQKPSQFGTILRHLQRLEPSGGERLAELLQRATQLFHRRSVVLLFSDLLESGEAVGTLFKQLRFLGHECLVFQILDRDEIEFPFTKAQVFRDLETGARRHVQPELIRKLYLERFGRFMEQHRALFQSLEMDHCLIRTDENPAHALRHFFSKRKKMN